MLDDKIKSRTRTETGIRIENLKAIKANKPIKAITAIEAFKNT